MTGPERYIRAEYLLQKSADVPYDQMQNVLLAAIGDALLALTAATVDAATGARVESWQHAFVGNRDEL
jgi:hypothetical protein